MVNPISTSEFSDPATTLSLMHSFSVNQTVSQEILPMESILHTSVSWVAWNKAFGFGFGFAYGGVYFLLLVLYQRYVRVHAFSC